MTTPIIFETGEQGERAYDVFSRLMKDRIIFISDVIDDDMANIVVAQLVFLSKAQPDEPIHLYINSPGGYVTSGLAIYDAMQYVTAPVHTLCIGQACSMAAVLLCAGSPGCRSALPSSTIMIHQPSGGARGTATDAQIGIDEMNRKKTYITEIISKHTGKSVKQARDTMERDHYMDAKQAKAWGMIDGIKTKQGK